MLRLLGLPVQASAHAAQIDGVLGWVHWLMAILFVGWGAFFVYTLIRFRAGANPKADYHGVKGHVSTWVEGGVALIEAVLLFGFSIPAWANRVDDIPSESEAVVVRVVGEQFLWSFHYPGTDGRFGRTDVNLVAADNPLGLDRSDPAARDDLTPPTLTLPVNRPVLLYLSTKDVIHSLSLNQMRVKQDAIPGVTFPVWFTPTMTGDWEINCSQLCGLGHFRMRGIYSIKTQEEYEAFLREEAALLAPAQ